MTSRRGEALLAAGYSALLGVTLLVTLGWLVIGGLVAAATYVPVIGDAVAGQATAGSRWAQGLLAAVAHSEPPGQAALDYAFSGLNLVIAAMLLFLGMRMWVSQLLAIAVIGSAGAFNLQAHAATVAVLTATGVNIGGLHQVLLHGVSCAAYVVALLLLPAPRRGSAASTPLSRHLLLAVGLGTLLVVGVGTALLPHTVSCILFFGLLVPLAGLMVLPRGMREGETAERRTQARLLFSLLLACLGTSAVLAVLTELLWYLNEPGLLLIDPTAHATAGAVAQPTALLFWFSRLSAAGIAASTLVILRRGGIWRAERLFSRGLAALAVIVLVGGGYVVISAVASWLPGTDSGWGRAIAAATATGLAALLFLPVYQWAERVVDRMLYGRRPTPYGVLADLVALSQATPAEGPDLTTVAEAVGRGLGARSCRLTVKRPGLRDRTYAWANGTPTGQPGTHLDGEEYVILPIREGSEQIGSLAVDRGAVSGVHRGQRALLDDVADSLGAILQASRLGIELERQLRAALAHAEDIAMSRRQAVAEMDSERRMIERDLHDGAQHHLVSLRLTLGLVEHQVSSGELEPARAFLGKLAEQVSNAEAVLAKTVSGVSSIVLAERGLPAALTADLAGAGPPITVRFGGGANGRRYSPEIEAAVYFCCLEAINNARKHAGGAPITVFIDEVEGTLRFRVRDEGPGFDPATVSKGGRGQRNLLARITSVGGRLAVDSAPGAGTTVHGSVPVPPADQPPRPPLTKRQPDRAGHPAADPTVPAGRLRPSGVPAGSGGLPGPHSLAGPAGVPRPSAAPGPDGRPASARRPAAPMPGADHAPAPARGRPVPSSMTVQPAVPAGPPAPVAAQPPVPAPPVNPPPPVVPSARAVPATESLALLDGDSLVERARALVRYAQRIFPEDPPARRLDRLATALDEPCRIAVAGASGPDPAGLVRTLREEPFQLPVELVEQLEAAEPAPDGRLVVLQGQPDADASALKPAGAVSATAAGDGSARPAPTIGVLIRGEAPPETVRRLLAEYRRDPAFSQHCPRVVAVPRRAGGPVDLAELREALRWWIVRPSEARRVHAALTELEELAWSPSAPAPDRDQLRYHLERVRSGAHELIEVSLAESLRRGTVPLTAADREAAERLLGAHGAEPGARLGLDEDADWRLMRDAAGERLAYWQRLAAHPASTAVVRDAAEVLVRTCEELLATRAGTPVEVAPASRTV